MKMSFDELHAWDLFVVALIRRGMNNLERPQDRPIPEVITTADRLIRERRDRTASDKVETFTPLPEENKS
jgi:hypothetical protein